MSFYYRRFPNKFLFYFKFSVLFILLVASNADCAQLSLEWDDSPSPGVDGYIVYFGTQTRNYTESVDVGNTTSCVISNLEEGQTYYFAASAYYNNNYDYIEGVPSEELSVEMPLATVPAADSDGDGITDDEELNVYGTDPQKADTDDDGLNDEAELAYWANDWNSDVDGDGLINLLDPDSDNDGISDGIEFDSGYDPTDPNSRPESAMIWLEAENGDLTSPVEVAWDAGSSSGSYIVVPNGSGNVRDPNQDAGTAWYTFQISEAGDYVIWGRVLAVSGLDDSFFISVDGGEFALWDTQQSNTWVWDQVEDRNGLDPVVYFLEAGEHTLLIKQREDGTKIDRILITNNTNYIPEGLGEDSTDPPVNVQYTLTMNAANSGSVSLKPAGGIYDEGTEVKLTAVADPGWEFSGWSGDLTGTANPITVTMNTDMNVSAIFIEEFISQSEKVWLEAENGDLISPVDVAWDESTSSGGYIVVPNGSGSVRDPNQNAGTAYYSFQVPESGDYMIWGRVLAPNARDDSFFISVDGGQFALWDTQRANTWVWDQVNNRNGLDPVIYNLEAGGHTLVVKQREDGIKLDKILVTNDFEYLPQGFGDEISAVFPTLETGEVSVDHNWQRVDLAQRFVNPVVVAKAVNSADADPAVVRIKNVTDTGFEICVQEWDYLDNKHSPETVGFIILETGLHTLPGGIGLVAGKFQTNQTSAFESRSFGHKFNTPPVVLASVTSFNESDAVTVRLKNITSSGFDIRMQEQEANSQTHMVEDICYIAWEPSSGSIGGTTFEVGKTGDIIKHQFLTISFYELFPEIPAFLADMQTTDGGDTANVRWDRKRINGVEVKIAEEQSKDSEINHTTEVVGYIATSSNN